MRKVLMPICPGCGHYVFRNLRCDDEKDAADQYDLGEDEQGS